MNRRFLLREAVAGYPQLTLFLLCVTLCVLTVAAVGGWRFTIELSMAREARQTAGGDVVAFSTLPFSGALEEALRPYKGVRTEEMYTVAVDPRSGQTLFSKLKSVEPGYPLYGSVPLASGGDLHQALGQGLVVESKVLERLHLKVGDQLKVGTRVFPIQDVALSEPDRPLGLWGISPRIFIASDQLDSTGLVKNFGSYVERRVHIRLSDPAQAEAVAGSLREKATADQERIETWKRPPVNIRRFVNNFFLYLDLVAAFTVALGGLGMQGTLRAWLRGRQAAIAIVRTLGATSGWTLRHYALLVALVTAPGIGLGLALAAMLLQASGGWLAGLLPGQVVPYLGLQSALQATALGVLVSAGFTLLPLERLRALRPSVILRREEPALAPWSRLKLVACLLVTTYLLLAVMVGNPGRAAACTGGLGALLGAIWLLVQGLLWGLRRWRPSRLDLRTALRGLLYAGSGSPAVMTVLGATLSVLFCLGLCERALDLAWVEAMPPQAPNLVFFDIQPAQAEAFRRAYGLPITLYPSLRARLQQLDGRPIPRSSPREYWERDARRELRGSSVPALDDDESLASGLSLFDATRGSEQVSVLDRVAEVAGIKVGSQVTLTIQGVPLRVRVSSLRHVVRESFRPTFDLLFPAALVEGAPQTIFATARVSEAQIGQLQSKIALAFPNITSMDVSETIRMVSEKLTRMVTLVRFLLLMGAGAGALVIVSTALASRLDRQREAAYYKLLGASNTFVGRVVVWENLCLGLLSSAVALGLAVAVCWGLCRWELDVPFPSTPGIWMVMLIGPGLLIATLGWLVSLPVTRSRPAAFLRDDA